MPWELDSDRPIYAQIVDRLKHEIVSGFYPPGSRLPSVRDLAAQASVETFPAIPAAASLRTVTFHGNVYSP